MIHNEIQAPKVDRRKLWSLSAEKFNEWRRLHDFPRIIAALKKELAAFEVWALDQGISDDLLLEFGIVDFLRPEQCIFLYEFQTENNAIEREIRKEEYAVGQVIFHKKTVKEKKRIIPFFKWVESNKSEATITEAELKIKFRAGRKSYIFNNLELLDLGDISLGPNFQLGNRFLDFLNLDDLDITQAFSSNWTRLWYSTAVNLRIRGDFAFLNAHCSVFSDVSNTRSRSLRAEDGRFQDWYFTQCDLNLRATNATLHLWKVEGTSFECFMDHSELKECKFNEGKIRFPFDYKRATDFHAKVKHLYSCLGQPSLAGHHFYKEKAFERKSLLRPVTHFRHPHPSKLHRLPKPFLYSFGYLKSFWLLANQVVWGFGERPSRTLACAITVIFLAAVTFFVHPSSTTSESFPDSLYFSIVTYTTLGHGEITQSNTFLRYVSSIEALLGLILTGLMIAGFAAKSKDYS